MILNSRNNLFEFKFPRKFIPQQVADKYRSYLNRLPGSVLSEPVDYINYSIQGISMPGIAFDPVEQNFNDGTITYHRGAIPIQNTINREFSVTMQLLDGFINYWIMMDTLLYYYSKQVKEPFIQDVSLNILDAEGNILATARFEKLIFKEIGELELNMSTNVAQFSTFDCTFNYNKFNLKIELD